MSLAIIDALVWLPLEWFTGSELDALCASLTVKQKGFNGADTEPILTYFFDEAKQFIGVPMMFGIKWLNQNALMEDAVTGTCEGGTYKARKLPDPFHPKALPGQRQFMGKLAETMDRRKVLLAEAPTGSGKTVCALWLSATLGITTLVIVPTITVADQWEQEAQEHLGLTLKEIGRIQEGQYRYEGCAVVIAVIHNIVQKEFPATFYSYFGLVVWDECHTLGARSFSQSMYMFPSRYKLGITATPNRKDGCGRIFLDYFGEPSVISEADALACDCVIVPYRKPGKPYPYEMPKARQINCVASDRGRNELIASILCHMFNAGRNILCVSDRVEHLQGLMAICFIAGIPEESMGLFVRGWVTEQGKKRSFKKDHLDNVKNNAQLIFATYGMFRFAMNVPRLDAGIDASPRSEGTQLIGRIRRPLPNKRRPVWFTIEDVGNVRLKKDLNARLNDYRASNVTILREWDEKAYTQLLNK